MKTPLTIIGAGPAGMTAALFAARTGIKVRLIDSNERVGRKLLVTGAGRANLTNRNMGGQFYTCQDSNWMNSLLEQFGYAHLIEFLKSVGVLTSPTLDGWFYPISESAQTVVDSFENALELAGVDLVLNTKVTSIRNHENMFQLTLASGPVLQCERLIVATGGKAYPTLGSRGELFPSLKALGHTVLPLRPALAPVTCEMKPYARLSGVRLDARASLYENETLIAETKGNLIFTDWGLNGPAVMDLSHHISNRSGAHLELRLNPLFSCESSLRELIQQQRDTPTPMRVILGAVLPQKLAVVMITKAGLDIDTRLNQINDSQLEKLLRLIKAIPFKVTGVRGFEYCQISAGGVPVSEVNPLNMRSRILPGLALVGETLDVVGPCGGYNLHFAFSSGAVAGMHAQD